MLRKTLSFLIALMFTLSASAQKQPSGIGLVMSGGGAKGLYHIGVLEALEESGVPIDYVAGTSMGSIIAAMYAAGYSPAEMRRIVLSGAVREWAFGMIDPNRYMAFYRQVAQAPALVNIRLDFKKGSSKPLLMPTNLISSTQVDLALMGLFAPATAAAGEDFDKLMIPFLCVASDMKERKPVVLRDGELSEAVRSSMSIPLVYKPMKRGDMILYDGGVFDNFPWKALRREFDPEFIVGSICTSGNSVPDENTDIFDQAFALAMQETDYDIPEETGVTIVRDVKVNMLDFDRAEEIMDAGYTDAMKKMPEILSRVSRRFTAAEFKARREEFRKKCPPLYFCDYHLEGMNRAQREYIRDFVHVDRQIKGRQRVMSFEKLRGKLFEVLASGDFTMDFPHVRYDTETDGYSFTANFRTKPNFKLSLGGCISSTAFNQAYIGINYQKIGRVAQVVGSEFFLGPLHTWGSVGGRTDFYMWKPLFIDYSFNFGVRNLHHGYFGGLTHIDNAKKVRENDYFGSFGFGMPMNLRGIFSLRANVGQQNFRYQALNGVPDDFDHSRFSYFGLKLEARRCTLDRFVFPRHGSDLDLSAVFVTGHEKLDPMDTDRFVSEECRQWVGGRFKWEKYIDFARKGWFSVGLYVDAVVTNHPDFARDRATLMSLPVFAPIPHSNMIYMPTFHGKRFLAGGIMPTFNFTQNLFLRTSVYTMWRNRRVHIPDIRELEGERERLHYIADMSLVYHTPVGPVSLSLTKYDFKSWRNMYLTLTLGYAIFAPKGTFY